MNSLKST